MKRELHAVSTWLAATGVAAAFVIVAMRGRHERSCVISEMEERNAAELVLAEKFSGPRYFHARPDTQPVDGVIWLAEQEALAQVPRIIKQRKLGPGAETDVRQLVAKLVEPGGSRAIGGSWINLSRLNLSLDQLEQASPFDP